MSLPDRDNYTQLSRIAGLGGPAGVPATALPFSARNTTEVDGTTSRSIKAGVAGKSLYISSIAYDQRTASEVQTTRVVDTAGSPVEVHRCTLGQENKVFHFSPPLKLDAGLGLSALALAATGDVTVTVNGWIDA